MKEKKKRKSGKYLAPKKTRKKGKFRAVWGLLFLIVLLAAGFALAQGWSHKELPRIPATAESTDAAQSLETEPDPMDAYQQILDRYARAVSEKWDFDQCEQNDVSYMVMFRDNLDHLGYYLVDLNGDDRMELIISDGNVIYNLYALVGGQVQKVVSGAERNSWQLCEGHILKNIGSNGAAGTIYDFYTWDGEKLVSQRNITFDLTQEEPVHTTSQGQTIALSEEEAFAMIDAYGQVSIPVSPMTD